MTAPLQPTTHEGAGASAEGAISRGCATLIGVGKGRPGLSDEDREQAICRAASLVEVFHAEYRLYEALWRRYGDFDSKAAYDLALSNFHTALRLRDSLCN